MLKMHKSWARVRISKGPWSEKKTNEAKQGAKGASKVTNMAVFLPFHGSKKWLFDAKCVGEILKNVLPAEGGEHIFKKRAKQMKENMPTGIERVYAAAKI